MDYPKIACKYGVINLKNKTLAASVDFSDKFRNYKLLLYPDNIDHMKVFHHIQRDTELSKYYIAILHDQEGKPHYHILLVFPNQRHWRSVCKQVGIDARFCRPIGVHVTENKKVKESLTHGYEYLVHANAPDKPFYNPGRLFGSERLLQDAMSVINAKMASKLSMATCLNAVLLYLAKHENTHVGKQELVAYLANSPYYKALNSRATWEVLREHNQMLLSEGFGTDDGCQG